MVRNLALAALIVGVVAAAWLLGGPARTASRETPRLSAASPRGASDPTFADVGGSSTRMQARLKAPAPLASSRRDPFSFYEPPPSPAPATRPRSAVVAASVEVPRPEMQLVGIAADGKDGQLSRVAVICAANQLVLAKEGDRLLARYLVVRVTEDAVQLKDGDATFTLAMK